MRRPALLSCIIAVALQFTDCGRDRVHPVTAFPASHYYVCETPPWDADGWVGPTLTGGNSYWHFTIPQWDGYDDIPFISAEWHPYGIQVGPGQACADATPPTWINGDLRGMRGMVTATGDYPGAYVHVHNYRTNAEECWLYTFDDGWRTIDFRWYAIMGGVDINPPLLH